MSSKLDARVHYGLPTDQGINCLSIAATNRSEFTNVGANRSNFTNVEINRSDFTDVEVHLTLFILALISVMSIAGNSFVYIAYYTHKSIRARNNNYFIISLCTADGVVGMVSVNLYAVYIAHHGWILGKYTCLFWLALDYWSYQVSVFGVIIISVDRLLVIRFPLINHSKMRTSRRIKLVILLKWAMSFLLWVPSVFYYRQEIAKGVRCNQKCFLPYQNHTWFAVATSVLSYLTPVFMMAYITGHTTYLILQNKAKFKKLIYLKSVRTRADKSMPRTNACNGRDYDKIALFLVIFAAAFVVTVSPYAIAAAIKPFYQDVIGDRAWRLVYTLGYVHSLLNPICYVIGNKMFNSAFKNIFCNRRKRRESISTFDLPEENLKQLPNLPSTYL